MAVSDKQCRLSVLLVTYNHEKYIRQALDALFRQQLNESIELVIADDSSSDSTLSIIREYEGKDLRFQFKYLDSLSNLGITKNYQRSFAECSGQYVAVLEGDDYWVSPFKLQRQCDFLDAHWECDLCSVNYFVFDEGQAQFAARTTIGQGHKFISARDLIADNVVGNFSTCMYRNSALIALPQALFNIKSYDWIINICIARNSLIGFLEEPMSVYRLHSAGVWTQASPVEKIKVQLELIPAYNSLTNNVFHADFDVLTRRLRQLIIKLEVSSMSDAFTKPTAYAVPKFIDYMPPLLMVIIRGLIPPIVKRLLAKVIHRSRIA